MHCSSASSKLKPASSIQSTDSSFIARCCPSDRFFCCCGLFIDEVFVFFSCIRRSYRRSFFVNSRRSYRRFFFSCRPSDRIALLLLSILSTLFSFTRRASKLKPSSSIQSTVSFLILLFYSAIRHTLTDPLFHDDSSRLLFVVVSVFSLTRSTRSIHRHAADCSFVDRHRVNDLSAPIHPIASLSPSARSRASSCTRARTQRGMILPSFVNRSPSIFHPSAHSRSSVDTSFVNNDSCRLLLIDRPSISSVGINPCRLPSLMDCLSPGTMVAFVSGDCF